MLLIVVAVGWYAVQSKPANPEFHFGGIACSDVQRELPKYITGELDPSIADKIKVHLSACNQCREAMQHMRSTDAAVDLELLDAITPTLATNDF